jgi:hypothetical protein
MASKKSRNHGNDENSSLDIVERFDTYENYLDSQLTPADMNYLEDDEMARQLVELGYRGLGDTIRRDVSKQKIVLSMPSKRSFSLGK